MDFLLGFNAPLNIRDTNQCNHFSLRNYVADKRKADWRKRWSIPKNKSKDEPPCPIFPPLKGAKFKWWGCENCRKDTIIEARDNIAPVIQQAPIPDDNIVRRDIDLNSLPIDISSDSDDDDDDLPKGNETGLENNLNYQVSIPTTEVCPQIEQEVQTEIIDVDEPPATNLINEHSMMHLPQDSNVCTDVVPMNNTSNVAEEDMMDLQLPKSTTLSDKGHARKRSVSKNGKKGFKKPTKVNESTSYPPTNMLADSQTPPVLSSDKVDVEEDTHANNRGSEGDEVNAVEPVAANLNNEDPEELIPLDPTVSTDVVPTDNNTENVSNKDLHWDSRGQKFRTLREILNKPTAAQTTKVNESEPQLPTNNPTNSDSLQILPEDGVGVEEEEGTTSRKRGRGRKRKCPSTEKTTIKRPNKRVRNEVQILEEDAKAVDDTNPDNELEEFCNKNSTDQTKMWLSLQEVTATHLLIKDSETNILGASNHNADVNSGKGKEVCIEENDGAENRAETVGTTMEASDMRTENSNQGTNDDIPMDVVEFMAKMQYEKTLYDEGNANNLFEKPTQNESGIIIREESVLPENRGKSINNKKKGKQIKKKSTTLDQPNSNANINLEKPSKKKGVGTSRRKNAKSLKNTSNQTPTTSNVVAAAEMLQSAFDPSHSNKKQKIGPSESGQNVISTYEEGECSKPTKQQKEASNENPWWFNLEININDMANRIVNVQRAEETPSSSNFHNENVCVLNRNPADIYILSDDDDTTSEDNVSEERNDLPAPRGRKSKKNLKGDKKK